MKVRRVDYSPDEFLNGTASMSNELVGAYWRLCSQMYSIGRPVPDDVDDICSRLKVKPAEWAMIRDKLVALGKLKKTRSGWVNGRTMEEIHKAEKRIGKARINGKGGGRPRKSEPNSAVEKNKNKSSSGDVQDTDKNETTIAVAHKNNSQNSALQKPEGYSGEKLSLTTNHQPPTTNKEDDDETRADLGSVEHIGVAKRVLEIIGVDPEDPRWFGSMARVEIWLKRGWSPDSLIYPAVERLAKRRGAQGPPGSIAYVEKAIASFEAEVNRPLPTADTPGKADETRSPAKPSAHQTFVEGGALAVRRIRDRQGI